MEKKFKSDGGIRDALKIYKSAFGMKGYMPNERRYDEDMAKYGAILDKYLEKAGITVSKTAVSMTPMSVDGKYIDEFLALIEWAYIRLQN